MKKKKGLFVAGGILLLVGINSLGWRIYISNNTPSEYMIQTANKPEYQQNVECAGYSAAYVLRHFGEDAHGLDLYNEITKKNDNGTVNPDAVTDLIRKKGHKASLRLGNVQVLRYYISRGTPVIILCREKPGSKYLHYMTIVGYDQDKFYAMDSLSYMVNENNEHYNRSISVSDLEQMWEIGYPVKNVYITVK